MKIWKVVGITLLTICFGGLAGCFSVDDMFEKEKEPQTSVERPNTDSSDNAGKDERPDDSGNDSSVESENPDNSGKDESYVRVTSLILGSYSKWFDVDWTGSNYVKKGTEVTATVRFARNDEGEIIAPLEDRYNGVISICDASVSVLSYEVEIDSEEPSWEVHFLRGGALEEDSYPTVDLVWSYTFTVPEDYEDGLLIITFLPGINGEVAM